MKKCILNLPEDFNEYSWEFKLRGCCQLDIEIYDKIYTFNFYDSVRLNQTIKDDLNSSQFFFYENLVVLESITIENIEKFIIYVMDTSYLNQFNSKLK